MAQVAITIKQKGLDEVKAYFDNVKLRMKNLDPPLKQGGILMLRSAETNFRFAGRPTWKPLAQSTLIWKLRNGYSPLPLTRSGDLRKSITFRVNRKILFVGTSIPYAAVHQLGGRHVPARPFLIFQDKDIERINQLIFEHIEGISNAG